MKNDHISPILQKLSIGYYIYQGGEKGRVYAYPTYLKSI